MVLCLQLLRLILKTAIITDKINEEGYVVNLKDILYITICIITVWLGLLLSILAHEAGHMIGYLLSAGKKKGNWYIAVGRGKQILKTKRLTIFAIPISGHFECKDDLSKKTSLLTLAGGPVASLFMTVVLFVLLGRTFSAILNAYKHINYALCYVAYYNLGLFIYTIIPLRYPAWLCKIPQSDGLSILRLLKRTRK